MLGVLGVFELEPNDAKAPDPRPKAEDAPDVGEATPVVVRGEMPLKGFGLPLSPPGRLAPEYVRAESSFVLSFPTLLEFDVDRDSLPELGLRRSISGCIAKMLSATYFERRCHRLSMNKILC